MTVKELKEKLNEFDDDIEIHFVMQCILNDNWCYPRPHNTKDMSKIEVYEDCGKCTIENEEFYYI